MTTLAASSAPAKPGATEAPRIPLRNPSQLSPDLAHPAITPITDFPTPPAGLIPYVPTNGYTAPMPTELIGQGLAGTAWEVVAWLANEIQINGHPGAFAPAGTLWSVIGQATRKKRRAIEVELAKLVKAGKITIEKGKLWRDGVYDFIWLNWAIRRGHSAEAPYRPAFALPGRQGAESCASTPGPLAAAGAGSCVTPSAPTDGAESCAIEVLPSSDVTSCDPESAGSCANVDVLSSLPELKTFTLARDPAQQPAPPAGSAEPERWMKDLTDAQVYAYLEPRYVFNSPLSYTVAIVELKARNLAIPERYSDKPLQFDAPAAPKPEVKRFTPPPAPPVEKPSLTLEQRLRELGRSEADAEAKGREALELAAWIFKALGESTGNVVSWRTHCRDLREVAARAMPAQVLIDGLTIFRAPTTESPRKAYSALVRDWREKQGLAAPKSYPGSVKRRAPVSSPESPGARNDRASN